MFRSKRRWYRILLISFLLSAVFFSIMAAASETDDYILYTLKAGDTLEDIAEMYDTTVKDILDENQLADSVVTVGKVIKIKDTLNTANHSQDKPQGNNVLSMEMRDADIRDVLSTIAIIMKKNIVYTETPATVSISVQNVSPMKALELLTHSIGMTYINNGDLILVGRSETLSQNFYTLLPITRFALNYISPEEINNQAENLSIPVQKIIMDSTEKFIWAQGTPQALSKMRELIYVLDREENIDPETQKATLQLVPVDLQFIKSDELSRLIEELNIPCKMVIVEINPGTLWVSADESDMADILSLVESVDIIENYVPEKMEEIVEIPRIEAKRMMNIPARKLLPLIEGMDIPVDVISIDSSGYSIWMRGDQDSINILNDLINRLDNEYARDDVNYFTYTLENLKAQEAAAKLEFIGLEDVRVFQMSYPQFSRNLLISCPSDRINAVRHVLAKLDVLGEKIKVIVDSSIQQSRLEKRRDFINTLTGIPKESFKISDNISRDSNAYYVLWVEESPENIEWIKEVIASMNNMAASTDGGGD